MNRDEYYAALNANRAYVEEHKDELKHWGIKGQKWGIRRYQNPDGTLTEEGKRHYGYKLAREAWAQTILEEHEKVYDPKASKAIGASMFGTLGAFAGAVEGGLTAGTAGAAVGGIGGAVLGSLLGISVEKLAGKLQDRSYKKSIERADRIIEKYGDEEYDGTKIKDLLKVYKENIQPNVESYFNSNESQRNAQTLA